MSQPTLYLHIGLPKSASTYLHDHIFPVIMPGRYLMPGAGNARKPEYRFRRNRFAVRRFSEAFQKNSAFWQHHGDEFLAQFLAPYMNGESDPESLLISDEAITRVNHFNIRNMPDALDVAETQANFRAFAEAVKRFGFSRVKVLLVVRRQDTLLASSYVQLSRKMVGASQADFEKRVHRLIETDSNPDATRFYSVNHFKMYQCLTGGLGEENITVLPLEAIAEEFSNATGRMLEFFSLEDTGQTFSQIPANSRSKTGNVWGLRRMLLLKSPRGRYELSVPHALTGRSSQIELTPQLASQIMGHFGESNKVLANRINQDLHKFGYC